MPRFAAVITVLVLCVPSVTLAADPPLSRRDGFLLIWSGIRRSSFPAKEKPFTDVLQGSPGFQEITYAKNRGFFDEETAFVPDGSLMLKDALLWLFRTRSVDDIDTLAREHLMDLLGRYPLPGSLEGERGSRAIPERAVTESELLSLSAALDGMLVKEDHEVSLYAEKFHGKGTAFGETFDMHAFTAAHRTYPHNTLVKVTNIESGKSVIARISDRGPFVKGRDMDLSLAAFTALAPRSKGKFRATFERLGDATLVGICTNPAYRRRITKTVILDPGIPHYLRLGESLDVCSSQWFVLRGLKYPEGEWQTVQDFIKPGDAFHFEPSVEGEYGFRFSTKEGKRREMTMNVVRCG